VAVAVALGVGLMVVTFTGPSSSPSPKAPAGADSVTNGAGSVAATQQPAPPQQPSATATQAPSAATPLIRQVRIESDPTGASVSEGDTQLCTSTPCELTWKDDVARAEHKLTVNKKGYRTFRATVSPTDEKLKAALEVIPMVAPPPPPPPPPATGRPLYKKDF